MTTLDIHADTVSAASKIVRRDPRFRGGYFLYRTGDLNYTASTEERDSIGHLVEFLDPAGPFTI